MIKHSDEIGGLLNVWVGTDIPQGSWNHLTSKLIDKQTKMKVTSKDTFCLEDLIEVNEEKRN